MYILLLMTFWIVANAQSPSAITSFDFLRSECLENHFKDHSANLSVGNLVKTYNNSFCLNSNGIGGFQVESLQNLTKLYLALSDSVMSIELWVQPQLENLNYYVLGLGSKVNAPLQCRFNLVVSLQTHVCAMV